jgi:hypothetical protein
LSEEEADADLDIRSELHGKALTMHESKTCGAGMAVRSRGTAWGLDPDLALELVG